MNDYLTVNNSPTRISKNDCIQTLFTDFTDLYAQLNDQDILITPNHRSVAVLKEDYNRYQQSKHQMNHWPSLQAMAYEEMLSSLITNHLPHNWHCLSSTQEHCLWIDAVNAAWPSDTRPVDLHMATLAMQAWRIAHEWGLPIEAMRHDANQDVAFFADCVRAFTQSLGSQAITLPESVAYVCQQSPQRSMPYQRIYFHGFDQISPSMQSLLAWLSSAYEVIWTHQAPSKHLYDMKCFATEEQEIEGMLNWMLESAKHEPAQRLMAVVPELDRLRPKIERLARQMTSLGPINMSGGVSLSSYPLVQHAFLILELVFHKRLPITSWGALLRSPFISGHEESAQRALLDESLRTYGQEQLNIKQVKKTAQSWMMPALSRLLKWAETEQVPQSCRPSDWVHQYKQWLDIAGWPGDRTLNSEEYQLQKSLDGVFKGCETLDTIYDKLSYNRMILRLNAMTESHLFQTESTDTGANILGALEASALPCDQLWLMTCSFGQWPSPPHPHPLLPIHLQKEQGTPHSSYEKTFAFTQQQLSRLIAHPKQVICSMAMQIDGMPQTPSPLIESMTACSFDLTPVSLEETKHDHEAGMLNHVIDAFITPELPNKTRFGTSLFRDQAHCPFSASAKHRLMATELPVMDTHVSPADLGLVVHAALDAFWTQTKDQATLLQMQEEDVSALVKQVTRQAIRQQMRFRVVTTSLQESLGQFIQQLIKSFLASEKKRPSFKVISCERHLEGAIQGIEFHGIMDRVDQFPDGRYALIDYKTGQVNPNEWFNDRLTQPQLPLYATFHSADFDAIVFAVIQSHQIQYRGLIGASHNWPELDSLSTEHPEKAWRALRSDWGKKLNDLAAEWLAGHAAVQPALHTSCQYCHLSLLCRIQH